MTIRNISRTILILSALLGLLQVPARAQAQPVLPELTFKRLLNDLQITVASTPYLGDHMTISLVLRYGATYDPADKGGLARLLSRMFMKATIDKSLKDIQEELDSLGATIEVKCDWDSFRFELNGSSAKFERSLLILYQVMCEAQFNPDDFASVKAEILKDLEKPEDPRQRTRAQLEKVLYKGTTYGRPLDGTPASVKNITLGDVRVFYNRHFSPNASSLVVIGAAPPEQVVQKAARIWGVWVRKDEIPFTFLPPVKPTAREMFVDDDPSSPAAQFILGTLWPRRDDPVYYPAVISARILQERLTKALPTSLLTVHTEGRRMSGPIYIQGQAAANESSSEIQKILQIVEELKSSPLTQEEVAQAEKGWIEEFNKEQTSTAGVCNSIVESELYRLGTNYSATFQDLVRHNGIDDVKEAAKEWIFAGGVIIVVRGPAAVLKPALEPLGSSRQLSP